MSAVDFWELAEPAVLKETGPALADQARIHLLPHAPCQTLPRPLNSAGFSIHQPVLHPALHSFSGGGSAFPTSGALLAKGGSTILSSIVLLTKEDPFTPLLTKSELNLTKSAVVFGKVSAG